MKEIAQKIRIAPVLQKWTVDPNVKLPVPLAQVLTPFESELGALKVVHPTPADPVLVSEKLGPVAIWFSF